jgi:AraC-like DNA-binding protein
LNSFDEEIPTLHSLALKVSLSPSRLGHLFREQTGLPLRQYRLWLRLQKALQSLTQNHSLTVAAHIAYFSDSAHLSRTFRRMFGIAPSELKVESNQGKSIPIK